MRGNAADGLADALADALAGDISDGLGCSA
jgi:hypothetical protein